MKKVIIMLPVFALAFFCSSCKKTDSGTTNTPTPSANTVSFGGDTYTEYQGVDGLNQTFFNNNVYELVAVTKTSDSKKYAGVYVFSLSNIRPTAGTYNIGGTVYQHTANQLQIVVSDSTAVGTGLYSSDSVTSLNVAVTVNNGKVSVTIPSIKLHGTFGPVGGTVYNDSITLAGNVSVQ